MYPEDSFLLGHRNLEQGDAGYQHRMDERMIVRRTFCCDLPGYILANRGCIYGLYQLNLTAKKYALSPGSSGVSLIMAFAYGGPQARVSSPRVGCSILITSALRD